MLVLRAVAVCWAVTIGGLVAPGAAADRVL
jgi:hypothetical protein